ncbi:alpha/beta hydrolase [Hydrogenophaga sp.]|uniref:alpha/beta hydrolase n=1 Tax=Hydrogenophaga sp. TaxID=1904254 RepID=UPI0019B2B081|nr:alpha/beta hydrolase [Hydrogenophaga sp.]MBD3892828.1 alpha/beta hydrolase [Hydrogenophaga sp.]
MSRRTHPRALLTPQMRALLLRMERARQLPLHALTPVQARQLHACGAGVLDIEPHPLARVQALRVPTRDGAELTACLFAPAAAAALPALPVLLYLHGGGFTLGSVATHEPLCRHLAYLAHCAVLSLDYRLAPEWKFPTAVNDVWDSLAWLRQQAPALRVDADRIAIGGDSAGGTLAAVTAIAARDAGWPLALQLLFYPGCAGHQNTDSQRTFARDFLLEESHINYFFEHYLRSRADLDDWRFAPLDGVDESAQVRDLEDVAPAWIGLAECDPLHDEGLLYADRLRQAGVAVALEIYPGVVHGFINFGRVIAQALQAHGDAARALRRAFGEP